MKFLSSIHFKILTHSLPFKLGEVTVFDDMGGKPVEGVLLSVSGRQNKQFLAVAIDAEGKARSVSLGEYRYLTTAEGAGMAMPQIYLWGRNYNSTDDTKLVSAITLLIDRSLHRPG